MDSDKKWPKSATSLGIKDTWERPKMERTIPANDDKSERIAKIAQEIKDFAEKQGVEFVITKGDKA